MESSKDYQLFAMIRGVVLAFLVVCYATGNNAQDCIPDPVADIQLENRTLSWSLSENCDTTHYIVNIHSNGVLEYVYQVDDDSLEVNFLSYCRPYTFTITAIANHIISTGTSYDATIDILPDNDITVSNFTGNQIDQDILLQWHIPLAYSYCAESYKLRIWDEDNEDPVEVTAYQNGYYLTNVAQCMSYQVEITVQYGDTEQPVAEFNYTVPEKPNNPTLVYVRAGITLINTTWALESYAINRCPVTTLYVSSTRFIAVLPVLDIPTRPTIDVTIPGLRANSMYFFTVTIENSAGNSTLPYQLAVQTLPIETQSQNLQSSNESLNEVEKR